MHNAGLVLIDLIIDLIIDLVTITAVGSDVGPALSTSHSPLQTQIGQRKCTHTQRVGTGSVVVVVAHPAMHVELR